MKFFIPLFLMLPLLSRGSSLVEKENEITKAFNELKEEEITTESINKIILLIDELEKLAQENSISSDNEDEEDEEDEDLDDFQDLKWFLEDLREYINSPSTKADVLDEWGEELAGCYDIIEKVKKQVMIRN